MPGTKLPQPVQNQVRTRAKYLCEYCHTSEKWQYVPFTIDHVIPIAQGGSDELDNLALACFHCNRQKSDRMTGIDPITNEEVPLFNPRQQQWATHFVWSSDALQVIGITETGRATVDALRFNRPRIISIRAADYAVGRHPPSQDTIIPG